MLVSVTPEVAWIEIHLARITRPTIRHKKRIKPKPIPTLQALPSPLPVTPCPLSLSPGIVMARYFDRECERRLLVCVMRRRLTAMFRLPHIKMTADSSILRRNANLGTADF